MFSQLILTKSFPAAIRRVREHRASGTAPCSSPAPSTSWSKPPLKPLFDDIVAPR
jgi:alcohol-forming fatty acyl-CoA reductase